MPGLLLKYNKLNGKVKRKLFGNVKDVPRTLEVRGTFVFWLALLNLSGLVKLKICVRF